MNKKDHYKSIKFILCKLFFIELIFLVCTMENVYSQKKIIQTKKIGTVTKKVNASSGYSTKEFDLNLSKVPIGYIGINPIELFKNLNSRSTNLTKGEFEKTTEFEQKVKLQNSKPIIGNLNEESLISLYAEDMNLNSFSYDADNELAKLSIELKKYENTKELESAYEPGEYHRLTELYKNKRNIELVCKTVKEYSYYGGNAFGATTKIDVTQATKYCLLIQNWRKFTNSGRENEMIEFQFKVDPKTAKIIKSKDLINGRTGILRALFIGNLSKPYILTGQYYSGIPKIDFPYEDTYDYKYINLEIREIWIYNKISGVIYTKLKSMNSNSINPIKSNEININMADDIP